MKSFLYSPDFCGFGEAFGFRSLATFLSFKKGSKKIPTLYLTPSYPFR